jgi:hypothetical protein
LGEAVTALAKTPVMETLSLQLPATAEGLAKLDAAVDELVELANEAEVTDDVTYSVTDEVLTALVQSVDAAKMLRGSVTGPVYVKIKEFEARFKPTLVKAETAVIKVKKQLGAYRIEVAQAEAAARDAALQAAASGDADALADSLNDADALARKPTDTGARVAVRWRVKRISPDLLPDEWWCPDEARIQEVALDHRGAVDDPPVIPGVVFEPVAEVKAKH